MSNSPTKSWTLPQVVARLAEQDAIQAVLQIGSLSRQQITPDSDYDLVIVLKELEQPWHVGITEIDHRFTDLIFVDGAQIEAIVALDTPVASTHALAPIIRWLRDGEPLFVRDTTIHEAQTKVRAGDWLMPTDDETVYQTWFSIHYNVAQTRRILRSANPLYQQVAAIRMAVYGQSDVWFGYLTIRKLPWSGDKTAVSHLHTHDPEFLQTYQTFISTSDTQEKFRWYEKAAALATAPLGGLWPVGSTVMNVMDNGRLQQWLHWFDDLDLTGDG